MSEEGGGNGGLRGWRVRVRWCFRDGGRFIDVRIDWREGFGGGGGGDGRGLWC